MQKQCLHCNNDFQTYRPSGKFCSSECYNRYYNRKLKGKVAKRTIRKMFHRAFPNWQCPYCEWDTTFEVHHIQALSKNGTNDLMNLVLLCPNHHSIASSLDEESLRANAIGNWYTEESFNAFRQIGHGQTKPKEMIKCACGRTMFPTSKKCKICSGYVENRPSKTELIEMKKTMSFRAIGKKYGVSDMAVRKWWQSYMGESYMAGRK